MGEEGPEEEEEKEEEEGREEEEEEEGGQVRAGQGPREGRAQEQASRRCLEEEGRRREEEGDRDLQARDAEQGLVGDLRHDEGHARRRDEGLVVLHQKEQVARWEDHQAGRGAEEGLRWRQHVQDGGGGEQAPEVSDCSLSCDVTFGSLIRG